MHTKIDLVENDLQEHKKYVKDQAKTIIHNLNIMLSSIIVTEKTHPKTEHWNLEFKNKVFDALDQYKEKVSQLLGEYESIRQKFTGWFEDGEYSTIINNYNGGKYNFSPLQKAINEYWSKRDAIIYRIIEEEKEKLKEQHLNIVRKLPEESEDTDNIYRILLDAVSQAELAYEDAEPSESWEIYREAQTKLENVEA